MKHMGDYDTSAVIYGKFTTFRPSTGAAYTLGGTPALSVYKDNSTTQSTSGVTLTADFDSVTGLNHFAIDTSADGTFYSAGSFFDIVITTGTVDSVSVVGSVVASFTLRKNSALKPATAGRTLTVDASGRGLADVDTIKTQTVTCAAGVTVLASVGTAATSTAQTGDAFARLGAPAGASVSADMAAVKAVLPAALVSGRMDASVGAMAANVMTAAAAAADLTTELQSGLATAADLATVAGYIDTEVAAIKAVTDALSPRLPGSGTLSILDAAGVRAAVGLASANLDTQLGDLPTAAENATAVLTTQMTEAYRANGAAPTLAQAQFEVIAHLGESSIAGTTKTINKIDHSTAAATFTLDSDTTPTSITRAT